RSALAGGGHPEAGDQKCGTRLCCHHASTTHPPRLLQTSDNHRGAVTTANYASMNSAAVTQDPAHGFYAPSPQWVVQGLSTVDSLSNTTTATSYKYVNPIFNPDDRGKYGF